MTANSGRDVFGRRDLMTTLGAAVSAPSIARAQGRDAAGVALVIGSSKYSWEAPLPNARRNVANMAGASRPAG